jgi:hypothetical protein
LLELLVAMTILLIVVMIVAQLFQQARLVVDSGTRRAEMNMKGRAVADFMAQELSMAVRRPTHPEFTVSGAGADFYMLGDATTATRAAQRVQYALVAGVATRNTQPLCDGLDGIEFVEDVAPYASNALPLFVDVRVTVSDGGTPPTLRVFESRACMLHRQRSSMD